MLWFVWGGALAAYPSVEEPHRTGRRADNESAVVIGIEDYFRLPSVAYAKRDAALMYDFLVYTRGLPSDRVHLLDRDATRETILEAVRRATDQASGGRVWVTYAGHGAAASADGARLWLGADTLATVGSFDGRGVRVDEVTRTIIDGGAEAVVVADACYTGTDRSGAALVPGARFAVPAYAHASRPGIVEWSAASANEASLPLDDVQHGAFTYLAVGALRGWADGERDGQRDGVVTADEASLYVRSALRSLQIDTQTPVLSATTPSTRVLSEGVSEPRPVWVAGGEAHSATSAEVASSPSPSPSPSEEARADGGGVPEEGGMDMGSVPASSGADPIAGLSRGFGRPMPKKIGDCKGRADAYRSKEERLRDEPDYYDCRLGAPYYTPWSVRAYQLGADDPDAFVAGATAAGADEASFASFSAVVHEKGTIYVAHCSTVFAFRSCEASPYLAEKGRVGECREEVEAFILAAARLGAACDG